MYARPGTVEVTVNALSSIVNDVPEVRVTWATKPPSGAPPRATRASEARHAPPVVFVSNEWLAIRLPGGGGGGGWAPDTVTCRVVVAGAPSSSVTRRPTVNVPVLVKVRVAVVPVPSSKLPSLSVSQARAAMAPSPSVEASVKVTCWPVWGDDGATVKEAVGAWFGGGVPDTVTCRVVVAGRRRRR